MREKKSDTKSQITSEQIDDLTQAVITLSQEVRILRHAVDEIEQELGWAIRTKVLDRLPPSDFPCDARLSLCSSDHDPYSFEHACDPDDLLVDGQPETTANTPQETSPAASPPSASRQAQLW